MVGHRCQRGLFPLSEVVHGGRIGLHHDHVEVDADDMATVTLGYVAGDAGAPVAALCAVAFIPESGHQRGPSVSDALGTPSGPGRLIAETLPRPGWAYDMERTRPASPARYPGGARPRQPLEI